jgi:hypothetical protein
MSKDYGLITATTDRKILPNGLISQSSFAIGEDKNKAAFFKSSYTLFNAPKSIGESLPYEIEKKNFTSSLRIAGGATKGNSRNDFKGQTQTMKTY